MMSSAHPILSAVLVVAMSTAMAAAQEPRGDIASGRRLAEHWCGSCHFMNAGGAPAGSNAPSLAQVAQLPSTTALALRVFLRTSHGGMPNIELTPADTDDLLAFILSLKTK